jgi:hypothetical protein
MGLHHALGIRALVVHGRRQNGWAIGGLCHVFGVRLSRGTSCEAFLGSRSGVWQGRGSARASSGNADSGTINKSTSARRRDAIT